MVVLGEARLAYNNAMSSRLLSALSLSLFIHAAVASGLWGPSWAASATGGWKRFENTVFIDPSALETVRRAKAAASAVAAAPKKAAPQPKPKQAAAAPKPSANPIPSVASLPREGAKLELPKSPAKPRETTAGSGVEKPSAAAGAAAGVVQEKSGADLMANPKTRGLFADYFSLVKSRIQEKLRQKCQGRKIGSGSVELAFVLQSNGHLQKVFVMERRSQADPQLKNLAIESLRESAPFEGFPKDFNARQIAFNLTVYFDDL